MDIESELFDMGCPPKDRHGYYGIVLKPKYMPLWLAKRLKSFLKVREGWLNMPYSKSDERWWFDYSNGRENSKQCEPIFWCKIRSYYKVKVVPNGGHPFSWGVEDPKGSYGVAE